MAQPGRLQAGRGDHPRLYGEGGEALRGGPSDHAFLEDKDTGKKVYRTEIVIGDITLLSDSKNGDGHSNGSGSGQDRSGVRDNGRSGSSGSQGGYDDYSDGLGIDESDIGLAL